MPANVSEQQIEAYTLEERYPMEYAPRKIKMPVDTAEYESFPVRPRHLDTNHHVNNDSTWLWQRNTCPPDSVCTRCGRSTRDRQCWEIS